MAIQNDDEDETKNMNRSISGGTSYIGGGYTGGGSMQNQEPKQTQDKGLGTGFKNISEYLSSPSESSRMAENIARGTDTQGMQAISQIKDYKTESAMKTNVPDFDPNVAGGWLYDVSTSGTAPGKTAQFTGKAPDTSYKGPSGYSSLAGYAPAQKSVADTQQRTKDSGTWEGTQEQLRSSTLPGTNYTPGMARFDTVITKSGPGAGVLDQSQKKWGNIGNFLGQAEGDVQNQITGAQAKSKEVTAQWKNAEELAKKKADETNKIYGDLATKKQQIAAMQPGPDAGNWTTPAQVPVAPAAPATTPRATAGSGMTPIEKRLMPDTDRMLTPTPGGAEYEPFRRSEAGRLSKEAQGGMYYYMQNNPINKGFTKTSDWLTKRIS
jgi:hypothetical protein